MIRLNDSLDTHHIVLLQVEEQQVKINTLEEWCSTKVQAVENEIEIVRQNERQWTDKIESEFKKVQDSQLEFQLKYEK